MPRRVGAVVAAGGAGPVAVGASWQRSALLVLLVLALVALVVALAAPGRSDLGRWRRCSR
jgi:hypothetical protein